VRTRPITARNEASSVYQTVSNSESKKSVIKSAPRSFSTTKSRGVKLQINAETTENGKFKQKSVVLLSTKKAK